MRSSGSVELPDAAADSKHQRASVQRSGRDGARPRITAACAPVVSAAPDPLRFDGWTPWHRSPTSTPCSVACKAGRAFLWAAGGMVPRGPAPCLREPSGPGCRPAQRRPGGVGDVHRQAWVSTLSESAGTEFRAASLSLSWCSSAHAGAALSRPLGLDELPLQSGIAGLRCMMVTLSSGNAERRCTAVRRCACGLDARNDRRQTGHRRTPRIG